MNKKQELVKFFRNNGGILKFSTILKADYHPDYLSILIKEKRVKKIARGLYMLSDYQINEYPDLVMVSFQAPRGIVCLVTALSFYEVTTEIPKYVDIAIPQNTHAYRIHYPPAKFYHFNSKSWKAGIEEHTVGDYKIRVYNLAKTIADCFKFRNRIGMDVVRESLKIAVTEKHVKPMEIMQYAKICRVDNIVKPILEAII